MEVVDEARRVRASRTKVDELNLRNRVRVSALRPEVHLSIPLYLPSVGVEEEVAPVGIRLHELKLEKLPETKFENLLANLHSRAKSAKLK